MKNAYFAKKESCGSCSAFVLFLFASEDRETASGLRGGSRFSFSRILMDAAFLPTNETGHRALDFPGGKINHHPQHLLWAAGDSYLYIWRSTQTQAPAVLGPQPLSTSSEYSPLVRYVTGGGDAPHSPFYCTGIVTIHWRAHRMEPNRAIPGTTCSEKGGGEAGPHHFKSPRICELLLFFLSHIANRFANRSPCFSTDR